MEYHPEYSVSIFDLHLFTKICIPLLIFRTSNKNNRNLSTVKHTTKIRPTHPITSKAINHGLSLAIRENVSIIYGIYPFLILHKMFFKYRCAIFLAFISIKLFIPKKIINTPTLTQAAFNINAIYVSIYRGRLTPIQIVIQKRIIFIPHLL